MKQFFFLLILLLLSTGCLRDELPNAEADILTCTLAETSLLKREPIIENDKITLFVEANADLTRQTLSFTLSDGATIEPAGGTTRDFSTPQTYTVTSQDRQWKKTYTVSFVVDELPTKYHFEDTVAEKSGRFYIFAEKQNGRVSMEWASGNLGFAMTGNAQIPDDYPTTQSADGYTGRCARLTTRSTGSFGALAGMPIAAGNLFIGTFDLLSALSSPLKATRFGLPFYRRPLYFSGYYKYKAGTTYYQNGQPTQTAITDRCHFYAVLYETDETLKTLDGTNILTHPNVVCAAVVEDQKETDEWTRFRLPFITREGKTIDAAKLRNGVYNLAVVFTSSIAGATFSGAPGSTLYIDEVEIGCE